MQRLDDRGLGSVIDFADEILGTLGGYREHIEVARAAIDDAARAARCLNCGREHRVHDRRSLPGSAANCLPGAASVGARARCSVCKPNILPAFANPLCRRRPKALFMTSPLERTRIVLCATSHPGNIGAAA